jgi:hypothetical protein
MIINKMVEYDVFERDMDLPESKNTFIPDDARFYRPAKSNRKITLLPIDNLLVGYQIHAIVESLQKSLNSDPTEIRTVDILRLSSKLGSLARRFLKGEPIEPIKVVIDSVINRPSPTGQDRPSFAGLDMPYIKQELGDNDYLYRPITGEEAVALSIYFKYNYIPSIITM